jgi:hypothetical protein
MFKSVQQVGQKIGALVWGIAGMILFLPFAAMLKVFCEEYEELKPIALLIGDQNYKEKKVVVNLSKEGLQRYKVGF